MTADKKRTVDSDWNTDLSQMPTKGRFQVMRIYGEVFRHMPDSHAVIEPMSGRMFTPFAWRKPRKRSPR